jgi:hypothetical protein
MVIPILLEPFHFVSATPVGQAKSPATIMVCFSLLETCGPKPRTFFLSVHPPQRDGFWLAARSKFQYKQIAGHCLAADWRHQSCSCRQTTLDQPERTSAREAA